MIQNVRSFWMTCFHLCRKEVSSFFFLTIQLFFFFWNEVSCEMWKAWINFYNVNSHDYCVIEYIVFNCWLKLFTGWLIQFIDLIPSYSCLWSSLNSNWAIFSKLSNNRIYWATIEFSKFSWVVAQFFKIIFHKLSRSLVLIVSRKR